MCDPLLFEPVDLPAARVHRGEIATVERPEPEVGPPGERADDTRTPGLVDVPREIIGGYPLSTRRPHAIPEGLRPYQHGRVRQVPFGLVDEQGVRVFRLDRDPRVFDHPVAQTQYALYAVESHRLSGEPRYLEVALANAERVVANDRELDGAWYFPYQFDFDLYRNGRGVLTAPWVSGMANGQALSLFARLHRVTGQQKWRVAADRTVAAFRQAPDGQGYFVSFLDDAGRLWLEEYPRYPAARSERVLNGHLWSMFGLWDLWMMHGQDHPEAERLFRGALHTVEETAMSDFRRPGWQSRYSLWQGKDAPTYHQHHQHQFLMLYRMTHDPVWISRAAAYRRDHPEWRDLGGPVLLAPGTRTLMRLDDRHVHIASRTMAVEETREVSVAALTQERYDRRGTVPGGPVVIRLSSGPHAGWWVEERPDEAWSPVPVEWHSYHPTATLVVPGPVRTAIRRYEPRTGQRIEERAVTLEPGRGYPTTASAIVEGRAQWRLDGAGRQDCWVADQPELTLSREPGRR